MADKRQAHRREPIVVEVRGRDVKVHPLPWLHRNDFGNELINQYTEIFNSALRSYVDPETNAPQIENALHDKLTDPIRLCEMGLTVYPDDGEPFRDVEDEFLRRLEWGELRELIYAMLDANDMESLKPLVDPNSLTRTENGGIGGSGALDRIRSTLNLPSTQDSSSVESHDEILSDSPTERSSTSSENTTDE